MSTSLRILFMGTPLFACPTLQMLIDRGEDIIAVVTQPDRPKGRGKQLQSPPVKELAEENDIMVLQPEKVRASNVIDQIKELAPDLIVVVAFGQILPKALLDIPVKGCINIHASLLPKYRGAAPINWCIINGEEETGITTMMMDVGLDTGDMLLKRTTRISREDNAVSLHDRLSKLGAEVMSDTLDLLIQGKISPEKQDDSLSCYAPMLKKEMGDIDWSMPPEAIVNLIRGLTPWPGAYSWSEGRMYKLFTPEICNGTGTPGKLITVGKSGLEIACNGGSLLFHEIQPEGKRKMMVADFLAGCNMMPGLIFHQRN